MAILLVIACSDPPEEAFVVDGFVDVTTARGSVIGVWELPGTPVRHFKFGDGPTLGKAFTLGFDTEPPPGAINADGIGVAYVVMLPELTTLPDGPVTLSSLPSLGISTDGAILNKTSDEKVPAWSQDLPLRFSCAQCVRASAPGTTIDTFVLQPCAAILVQPSMDRCNWF